MLLSIVRLILAAALFAIVAWLIAWRRARPDLCPLWLAVKFGLLLTSIGAAAVSTATEHRGGSVLCLSIAAAVALVIAARLWLTRRWLAHPLGPADAAREARRLADEALELADRAERGRSRGD